MSNKVKYNSLDDFMKSKPLNADGVLNDGWGEWYSVKGIELEGTVLFADISNFSGRTIDLNPIETLIFVNNFFTWITAEALKDCHGIIDKYIGDEIMIVFSKEFGSENHFIDAVRTASFIAENDHLRFNPHIGIASGDIAVGYVGTPLKYNCSVFGRPVALAARCAGKTSSKNTSSIIFPTDLNKSNSLDDLIPPKEKVGFPEPFQTWEMLPEKEVEIKNMNHIKLTELVCKVHYTGISPEEIARKNLEILKENGLYRKYNKKV